MRTSLFLKTSTELLADCEARLNDTGNALAVDAVYYQAINEAIRMWWGRVLSPHVYSISGGFVAGVYEYSLPNHVRPPFVVQTRTLTYNIIQGQIVENDTNYTWSNVAGYAVEPTATGGWTLRLPVSPYTDEGRIIYWTENGPMITSSVTLTSGCDADDTTIALTVTGGPDVFQSGFVKIENEWLSYGDITRTSATSYTLTNCVRGLYGTRAASHNSAVAVTWGVGIDDPRLWIQLLDYVTGYIHGYQSHKGTTEDVGHHERQMSYYNTRAENFWRQTGYIPARKPKMKIDASAIGPIAW